MYRVATLLVLAGLVAGCADGRNRPAAVVEDETPPPPPAPSAPVIDSFIVDPDMLPLGYCSILSWETTGADTVSIDNGVVSTDVDGSEQVCPTEDTIYTLTATGPGGTTTAQVTVYVDSEPNPCFPTLINLPTGGADIVQTNRLQGVLDDLTGEENRIVAVTDFVTDDWDTFWEIDADEAEAVAVIVIEIAGFKNGNLFGIYDANDPHNRVQLFDGPDGASDSIVLEVMSNGSVLIDGGTAGAFTSGRFGFYLDSTAFKRGGLFFSDSSLNPEGNDYMVAYQGDGQMSVDPPGEEFGEEVFQLNEFIIGFEDLAPIADRDYEDFVVLISGLFPSPNCDQEAQ